MVRTIKNYDVNLNEYLCPICSRLSNSVLPLSPAVTNFLPLCQAGHQQSFYAWTDKAKKMATNKTLEEMSDSVAKEAKRAINSSDLPKLVLASNNGAQLRRSTRLATSEFRPVPQFPKSPKLAMPMPDMLSNMGSTFAINLLSKSLGTDVLIDDDYRTLQLCFQACSTSLHFFQSKRDRKPMLDGATDREMDVLRSMVRLCVLHPLSDQSHKKALLSRPSKSTNSPMMRYLRANGLYLLSVFLLDDQEKSFLQIDPLNALMLLNVAFPAITYPEEERIFSFGRDDQYILALLLTVHLLQVLLGFTDLPQEQRDSLPDCPYADQNCTLRLWKQVAAVSSAGLPTVAPADLGAQCRYKVSRFLRCAALFYHFCTDIPLPPALSVGATTPPRHEDLCRYLGLPETLRDLLMLLGVQDVIDRLLQGGRVHRQFAPDLPIRPRRLVDLPSEYRVLIDRAADYRCPNNPTGECRSPCLCLVCGEIVCSQSTCCEEMVNGLRSGGCTVHANKCGATQGMFLKLRTCEVLLLSESKRGLLMAAPYVDDYGECDEGLLRGNPLHFNAEMYEDLQKTWANNDIPDRISRSFDDDVIIIRAVWHQL